MLSFGTDAVLQDPMIHHEIASSHETEFVLRDPRPTFGTDELLQDRHRVAFWIDQ